MKTPSRSNLAALAITIIAGQSPCVMAGPVSSEVIETPPAAAEWEFRVEPYGWLTNVEGTVGAGGITTDVDAGFFDDIIDQLEMAAALQFEARRGRWGIIMDGFYSELGFSGAPPGPLYDEVSADFQQFIGELDIAYRVYESPRAFVDVYAGFRYTALSLDLEAQVNQTAVTGASFSAGNRITNGMIERADEIAGPRSSEFISATVSERAAIEAELLNSISAEADARVRLDLERELARIRQSGVPGGVALDFEKASFAVRNQRQALAESTARLKIAELRASADSSLLGAVAAARAAVDQAKQDLAEALDEVISDELPSSASADKDWIDPILGVRSQWNLNDRWFLAARGDIGGFGVSSDFAWSLQATVGYNFTGKVSAELGYRYFYADYTDGGFTNDLTQSGIYTGVNIKF